MTSQWKVLSLLQSQWDKACAALTPMLFEVRPADAHQIFVVDPATLLDAIVRVEINPVVFHVPERAVNGDINLYISVRGRLGLDAQALAEGELVTADFGTEAAYFREVPTGLQHIYGAHFDYAADEIGHPIFHMQMRSYPERVEHLEAQYQLGASTPTDHVKDVLRTVRLPSGQMDFFTFLVQIAADHLISHDSGKEDRAAFDTLRQQMMAIKGIGSLLPRLTQAVCTRGIHWYPVAS